MKAAKLGHLCVVALLASGIVGCAQRRDEGAQAVRGEMKPSSTERPGCVDAERDAERRLFDGQTMAEYFPGGDGRLIVDRELDLDGDGAKDPFVTSNLSCGSGGCDYVMYVEHAYGCARYVGRAWGDPTALERRPNGWLDLEYDSHGGYQTLTWLRYVGDRYELHQLKHCPWGSPYDRFDAAPDSTDGCEAWHTPTKADEDL